MLRAISDTEVAITVRCVRVKPTRVASSRAAWRASTMSRSVRMGTCTSSSRF
jgi:hypothetical protein